MTTKVGNNAPAAARKSGQTTPQEQTQAWQGVLNSAVDQMNDPEIKGSTKYLGEGRINTVKQKVQSDMEAFIQSNPNASADDIKKEAESTTKKHETNAMFQKMRDDNFFGKLMSRRKELIKDMWG
ncbi:hypothetical protein [Corallococcus macrosporus]|uniref:Uncharacterized protein n=2 Tax=Myxococcaceae TaxID=31 RepID=A0A250JTJ5_9BACT|nr:hypothetical protein [Corallococcus macrosporus]AEI65895.1 hypothetical protein LILAB_19965 [Corallococcus macrosporus]ATB46812.1 hypothetical protein MYMAC_002417 [Corallococcus macrosporus DSM 14697]